MSGPTRLEDRDSWSFKSTSLLNAGLFSNAETATLAA
jgi:hypothetical protein